MSEDKKREGAAVPPASQIAAAASAGAKAPGDAAAPTSPSPPAVPAKPADPAPKAPPPDLGKPVSGTAADPAKTTAQPIPAPGRPDAKAVVEPARPTLPPPVETPVAARPGRGLAWLALVVGLLGLAAGVVAVAGPRLLALADRQFPQAAWIEPAGQVLNPGWSVTAAEFDRRVNLLEGVLAKAQPGAVSREDIVELLLGRFEGKRGAEARSAVDGLRRETDDLGRGLERARQAAEARATALATRIDGVEPKLAALAARIDETAPRLAGLDAAIKGRLDAIDGGIAAARTSIDEIRAQIAALSPLAERTGRVEAEAAAIAKRLDETVGALDEIKRRAAGPERLLVAVLQLQISSQAGRPFAEELRLIRQIIGADAALARPLESLSVPAQRGAPTLADLRDQFGQASGVIVERGVRDSRTWIERVGAGVKGTLAGVGLAPPPPLTPVEASVAETQRQLANGNLLAALTEIETLDAPVRALAGGWIAQARLRLAVDQAVGAVTNAALERASRAP